MQDRVPSGLHTDGEKSLTELSPWFEDTAFTTSTSDRVLASACRVCSIICAFFSEMPA